MKGKSIRIIDPQGKQIMLHEVKDEQRLELDTSSLSDGIYILELQTVDGTQHSSKLVIQR
jgi:hypothetical protein